MGGLVLLLIALLVLLGDSLVPVWLFVTSLTFLTHIVVLRHELPNNVFIVLRSMLKILRLDFVSLDADGGRLPPDDLFIAGYTSTRFVTNLGYNLCGISATVLAMFFFGSIKDVLTPKCCRCRATWSTMMNLLIRFVLLAALEFSICACLEINSAANQLTSLDTTDSKVHFGAAVLTASIILLVLVYLIALQCRFKWALKPAQARQEKAPAKTAFSVQSQVVKIEDVSGKQNLYDEKADQSEQSEQASPSQKAISEASERLEENKEENPC